MKNVLTIFGIVVLAIGIFLGGYFFNEYGKPLGIATNEISYSGATNASTTCYASTSTVVLATGTARTSFHASIVGSTSTYLCRGVACTTITGINLTANAPRFDQTDSYIGPYSCFGTSTSTLVTSYSQ